MSLKNFFRSPQAETPGPLAAHQLQGSPMPASMMEPFGDLREIATLDRSSFEKRCRSFTGSAYLGNNTVLCRILTRYKMFVSAQDLGVVPHLIMDGFWESWLTQCLARIVKQGDICIDIGANFGYFTLLMSELSGKDGRTIAIEPNPGICDFLRMTQSVHAPFEIVETALSNTSGEITLKIPLAHPGSASITERHIQPVGAFKEITVPLQTLDSLVKELGLPRVDIIKIDVEGVEPEVFEGMKDTLAKNPDLQIVMEYSPFAYEQATAFTQSLFDRFTVHRIKDVDQMTLLDESAIPELVKLMDHTDLYLSRKMEQKEPSSKN